jgi:tRNA threonylcarbamoyladenosine biosynthesis protein TsaE
VKPKLRIIERAIYNALVIAVINLPDEAATAALASRLATAVASGDIIAMSGDLGTGKTAFARAFIRAWLGIDKEVPSPTFTLVQVYDSARGAIWHFDLYRLKAPEEAWELGIEEAFASGISLIEWPDRLGGLLPAGRLEIMLEFGDRPDARRAVINGSADWRTRLRGRLADV